MSCKSAGVFTLQHTDSMRSQSQSGRGGLLLLVRWGRQLSQLRLLHNLLPCGFFTYSFILLSPVRHWADGMAHRASSPTWLWFFCVQNSHYTEACPAPGPAFLGCHWTVGVSGVRPCPWHCCADSSQRGFPVGTP